MAYDVTGMSPQSITLPQKLKGLMSCGLTVVSMLIVAVVFQMLAYTL